MIFKFTFLLFQIFILEASFSGQYYSTFHISFTCSGIVCGCNIPAIPHLSLSISHVSSFGLLYKNFFSSSYRKYNGFFFFGYRRLKLNWLCTNLSRAVYVLIMEKFLLREILFVEKFLLSILFEY